MNVDLAAIQARAQAAQLDNDAARAYAADCAIDDVIALLAALREARQIISTAADFIGASPLEGALDFEAGARAFLASVTDSKEAPK